LQNDFDDFQIFKEEKKNAKKSKGKINFQMMNPKQN